MAGLTDEQRLTIDLELPTEAWEYEEFSPEDLGSLFRLIFWTGYVRGRSDTFAKLEREVEQCGSTL